MGPTFGPVMVRGLGGPGLYLCLALAGCTAPQLQGSRTSDVSPETVLCGYRLDRPLLAEGELAHPTDGADCIPPERGPQLSVGFRLGTWWFSVRAPRALGDGDVLLSARDPAVSLIAADGNWSCTDWDGSVQFSEAAQWTLALDVVCAEPPGDGHAIRGTVWGDL